MSNQVLEALRSRLYLYIRLLASVLFHRLWLYWQQIDGIAADRISYLISDTGKFVAEKKELPRAGSKDTQSIYICFCTIDPVQNLYNGIRATGRWWLPLIIQNFRVCIPFMGRNKTVCAWSVCLSYLIHVSREIRMGRESMVKEKECREDCFSAPTPALMGRKWVGAGDLCKENNHQ